MQAYEGYVENGRFYPIGKVARMLGRRRAVLTILDEPVKPASEEEEKSFWAEFDRLAKASADEELRDEDFPRMTFKRDLVAFTDEE